MRSSKNSKKKAILAVIALGCVGTLVACSSAAGSSGGRSAKTVPVDVGTGTPVNLSTGKLKLALVMNDTSNEWEQDVIKGAQDTATKNGWTLDVFNPGFDVQKQLNQVQTIASGGRYDAVLAVPVDGKLTCDAFSKSLPQANVLVSVGATQLCGRNSAEGNDLWQPGTLNWVGGTGVSAQYIRSWLDVSVQKNPGPQKAVIIMGPEVITVSNTTNTILAEWQKKNPDFKVTDRVYTDFTTPDAYKKTLDYLQAHPDTTVILSTYSPDLTRGVIQAVKALGMENRVKIADSGGAKYTFDQISAGAIQFTSPLFPRETGQFMVDAIKDAQDGKAPVRFVSDIPASLGDLNHIPIFTKDNMASFTPEF